jgi:hypothetical protein
VASKIECTRWRMLRDTDAVHCADAIQCTNGRSYIATADQILFTKFAGPSCGNAVAVKLVVPPRLLI